MLNKELRDFVDMADPDGALESAGWCATGGGAVFGKKGEPLQTLSFGKPSCFRAAPLTSS